MALRPYWKCELIDRLVCDYKRITRSRRAILLLLLLKFVHSNSKVSPAFSSSLLSCSASHTNFQQLLVLSRKMLEGTDALWGASALFVICIFISKLTLPWKLLRDFLYTFLFNIYICNCCLCLLHPFEHAHTHLFVLLISKKIFYKCPLHWPWQVQSNTFMETHEARNPCPTTSTSAAPLWQPGLSRTRTALQPWIKPLSRQAYYRARLGWDIARCVVHSVYETTWQPLTKNTWAQRSQSTLMTQRQAGRQLGST